MKCRKIRIDLKDYLDNHVNNELKAQIDAHLATCRDCRAELTFLQIYRQKLQTAMEVEAPADLLIKIHQQLDAVQPVRKKGFRKILRPMPVLLSGFAGTLVLAVFLICCFKPLNLNKSWDLLFNNLNPKEVAQTPVAHSQGALEKCIMPTTGEKSRIKLVVPLEIAGSGAAAEENTMEKGFAPENIDAVKIENDASEEKSLNLPEASAEPTVIPANILVIKLKTLLKATHAVIRNEQKDNLTKLPQQIRFVISARHYPSLLTGLRELGKCEAPSLSKDTLNFDLDIILKIHFQP